jgi:hypothetical protein
MLVSTIPVASSWSLACQSEIVIVYTDLIVDQIGDEAASIYLRLLMTCPLFPPARGYLMAQGRPVSFDEKTDAYVKAAIYIRGV